MHRRQSVQELRALLHALLGLRAVLLQVRSVPSGDAAGSWLLCVRLFVPVNSRVWQQTMRYVSPIYRVILIFWTVTLLNKDIYILDTTLCLTLPHTWKPTPYMQPVPVRRRPWRWSIQGLCVASWIEDNICLYCSDIHLIHNSYTFFMLLDIQWKALENHIGHFYFMYLYIWTVEYLLHLLYRKLPRLHSGETSGPRKFREIAVELPKSSQTATWFLSFASPFSFFPFLRFFFLKKCPSKGRPIPFSFW